MTALARRNWVPDPIEDYVLGIADATSRERADKVDRQIHALIDETGASMRMSASTSIPRPM